MSRILRRMLILIFFANIIFFTSCDDVAAKESLTFMYAGNSQAYLKQLAETKKSITTIAPDYFDITDDGNLLITPSNKIDTEFITNMKSNNIKVTPFISNHWDRDKGVAAMKNRRTLAQQIISAIVQYDLDGMNIDIENVSHIHRSEYTDFIRILRENLPPNKILTVAVAANPNNWQAGWHGSYDYKALSNYADYLMIMTYDESYYGSSAGPVSSISFFEKSIQYALSVGVLKSKIVVGLPFFGRYWKTDETIGGYGITSRDVEYLSQNYETSYKYFTNSQSAQVIVNIYPNDPKPKLSGGKILNEGEYEIWYDNDNSIKRKLEVTNSYGIKGVGSWALGQECPSVWSYYSEYLNPSVPATTLPTPTPEVVAYPSPLPTLTPAEAPSSQMTLTSLLELLKDNVRLINKHTELTRGEAAVIIARTSSLKPPANTTEFSDTVGYWGEREIQALKGMNVIVGRPDNLFHPEDNITREEFIAMIDRILNLPEMIDFHCADYTDIESDRWSFYSINKLCYFDIIKGFPDKSFRPNDRIVAEQVVLFISRVQDIDRKPQFSKFQQIPIEPH